MSSDGFAPYLSVVATTRNDNHGGDLLHRTQVFLDGLAEQCERHGLDAELVLVEWNPPEDRPRLAEALRWPETGGHFEARIIEVPESIHRRFDHADRLPLFQMIAKNVGIRRARGEFVLATNVDLLFSDELIAFLTKRKLDRKHLYRVDRYDVDAGIPDAPLPARLAWCETNLIRICRREGTYDVRTGRFYRIYENTRTPLWLAPWLRLARYVGRRTRFAVVALIASLSRSVQRGTRRTARATSTVILTASRIALKLASGKRSRSSARRTRRQQRRWPCPSLHLAVRLPRAQVMASARSAVSLRWSFVRRAALAERARMRLHTNACGDFTLLSREGWFITGGYPELEMFSMHIDSLFMYGAHYSGFRESLLPYRVYHLEHGAGFRPDETSLEELNSRLEQAAIPQISNEQFLDWVIEMRHGKRSAFSTPAAWGLAVARLDETRVLSRVPDTLQRVSEPTAVVS